MPCTGRELQAQLKIAAASDGRRTAALGLRNKSSSPCTVDGYPDLQLLASGADPISTSPVHIGAKTRVSVAPGATAWSALSWSVVAGSGDPSTGACGPTVSKVAVFAPDDTVELDVPFSAGSVCQHGRIEVGPLKA
jgi:hypothetical protein